MSGTLLLLLLPLNIIIIIIMSLTLVCNESHLKFNVTISVQNILRSQTWLVQVLNLIF